MASPRVFHVRKALNRLTRCDLPSPVARSLSNFPRNTPVDDPADTVSIDEEPPTAAATARFLQQQDQVKLQEAHSTFNAYLRDVRALQTHAHERSSIKVSPDLPAYILTKFRAKAQEIDVAKDHIFHHGMKLKEHLTDLQHEPYKADMDEQLHAWRKEFAAMDDGEVADAYASSDLVDAVELNRLKKRVNALYEKMVPKGAMMSEEGDEVVNPFGKQAGGNVAGNATGRTSDWGGTRRTPLGKSKVEQGTRPMPSIASSEQRSTSSSAAWPTTSTPKPEPSSVDVQALSTDSQKALSPKSLANTSHDSPGRVRTFPNGKARRSQLSNSSDENCASIKGPPSDAEVPPVSAPVKASPNPLLKLVDEQKRLEAEMKKGQTKR